MSKEIREYKRGDAPTVRIGYLRGVILQDGTFNRDGVCLFISETDGGATQCASGDLFVDVDDDS